MFSFSYSTLENRFKAQASHAIENSRFHIRSALLDVKLRMHFCMNIFDCSEIDCVCEQTKQTFVSLKYSINTFHPLNKTAVFFCETRFTIVSIGFDGNFRRYTWASRNVIKPKHYKTNMQFGYLLLSCKRTCWYSSALWNLREQRRLYII